MDVFILQINLLRFLTGINDFFELKYHAGIS
jgi:hypothetical protein